MVHYMAYMAETFSVEQRKLNEKQSPIYNKAARKRQHNLKTYMELNTTTRETTSYACTQELPWKGCITYFTSNNFWN
jgi:hypothetical protein